MPPDFNLPSACLLDPFLVLNYFLQTGAYKKKQTRIRHSCQSQKLSKLLPQNKLPDSTVNLASIKPPPSETQAHASEGSKLQTRLSTCTAQNHACPWARGHGCWQDPSLGSPQQHLLNRGREHTCSPPGSKAGAKERLLFSHHCAKLGPRCGARKPLCSVESQTPKESSWKPGLRTSHLMFLS